MSGCKRTYVVLFFVNFILFRYVVYRSKQGAVSKQFVGYVFVTVGIAILEYMTFSRIYDKVGKYRNAVIVVTLCATFLRFIFFKYMVFKR